MKRFTTVSVYSDGEKIANLKYPNDLRVPNMGEVLIITSGDNKYYGVVAEVRTIIYKDFQEIRISMDCTLKENVEDGED